MTDAAVKRALDAAIRNAQLMTRVCKTPAAAEEAAIRYADGLVLPIVEARVEQALEEGFQSAHKAKPAAGAA